MNGALAPKGMQTRDLPLPGGHYWALILVASAIGLSLGDFIARLGMGKALGLLLMLGVLGILAIANRRLRLATVPFYWLTLIAVKTAALCLGDAFARSSGLGKGGGSVVFGLVLLACVYEIKRQAAQPGSLSPQAAETGKHLPAADFRCWVVMLIASSLGTCMGDFVADGLGFGPWGGAMLAGMLFAVVLSFEMKAEVASTARYWLLIAVAALVGTNFGDFLAEDDGANLRAGGALCVEIPFLVLVFVLPALRRAAWRKWPILGSIWGMARNDVAVWLRSPAAIAAALLPALGMGVLVAMLTASVGKQPTALVVEGEGRFATRMARLVAGDKDAYQIEKMTGEEAEKAFGEQRVAAVVRIPADFDAQVAMGTASVHLHLNNVNIDISDDLRRSVTRSVAEFDAPQLGLLGELHGPSKGLLLPNPYRVAVAEHDLRETEVSFLQYQVIPIILLVVISIGLLGTALLTARDFERATAKMIILSPVGRLPLVLGRLLGGTLITFALVTPLVALGFMTQAIPYCREDANVPVWVSVLLSGACAWNLPLPSGSHALALLALLLAVTLATVGMGTLIGVALRDTRLVTMTALNVACYLFFLGGGFTTVAFLPDWIQAVSALVPTSYAINGLRQALFYPTLIGFGRDLSVLVGCAALSVALASLMLTRAWSRR